jgi:NADH:ubiquinone oxidoreductase subunit K
LFVFFVITVAAAEVAVGLTGLLLTDLGREFNS